MLNVDIIYWKFWIPKGKRIDAIFRTYPRKTYIFYDRVLYIEFNECLFRSKKNDLISELFAGIPPNTVWSEVIYI
jgi:hypothetical protein